MWDGIIGFLLIFTTAACGSFWPQLSQMVAASIGSGAPVESLAEIASASPLATIRHSLRQANPRNNAVLQIAAPP